MQAAQPAQPTATLTVIRIGESWVLLNGGRRWGRFRAHGQALAAALRLKAEAKARSRRLDILDQEPWGEIVPLDGSPMALLCSRA